MPSQFVKYQMPSFMQNMSSERKGTLYFTNIFSIITVFHNVEKFFLMREENNISHFFFNCITSSFFPSMIHCASTCIKNLFCS